MLSSHFFFFWRITIFLALIDDLQKFTNSIPWMSDEDKWSGQLTEFITAVALYQASKSL